MSIPAPAETGLAATELAGANLDEAKAALRKTAHEVRDGAARRNLAAGTALADRFADGLAPATPVTVSAYWPIGSEIDPRPLMAQLAARGHRLCLPAVAGPGAALIFREWSQGDPLAPADFGTREPTATAAAVEPDMLLVPLLAFDQRGYRLGYGGGYYDRTLEAARAARPIMAVGLAFAEQEVAEVPAGPMDQPLDVIVTDAAVFHV